MELLNSINSYIRDNEKINKKILIEVVEDFVRLLSPLAPHFAEELWEELGKTQSVYKEEWPKVNEKQLTGGIKEIPVQVNGKLKMCISVDADATPEEILTAIKSDSKVKELFSKYDVQKEIYVPGRIYNLVIKN